MSPETNIYGNQWRLRIGKRFIYKNTRRNIYDARHGVTLKRHIMKRKGYSLTILNTIDWDGVELAGKSLSVGELTWLMKHVARYNPVGRQLKRRKYWIDSKCPHCNAPNEDSTHVVFCPHASAVATLADSALAFETSLRSNSTHPLLLETLVMTVHDCGSTSFRDNIPNQTEDTSDFLYGLICDAENDQDCIGF